MPIVLGLLAFLTVVTMVIGTVASFGFLFVAGLQKTYTAPKPSALSSSFSTYGGTVLGANCGIPEKIRPLINRASKVHDIDAAIIAGIMKQESAFNPGATSGVGAAGLMQLMPETYTWLLGVQVGGNSGSLNSYKSLFSQEITNDPEFLRDQTDQRYNPGVNAYLGTLYIKYLLGFPIVKGNVNFALAAYNAGQGNVEHYGGIPPFAETINYVKVVSQNISQFKSCLEQKTSSSSAAKKLRDFVNKNPSRTCQFTTDLTTPGGSACFRTTDAVVDEVFPNNNSSQDLYTRTSHDPTQQDLDTMQNLLAEDKIPVLQVRGDASGQHWIAITDVRGSTINDAVIEYYDPAVGQIRTRAFNSPSGSSHGGYYFGMNTTQATDRYLRGIVVDPND